MNRYAILADEASVYAWKIFAMHQTMKNICLSRLSEVFFVIYSVADFET